MIGDNGICDRIAEPARAGVAVWVRDAGAGFPYTRGCKQRVGEFEMVGLIEGTALFNGLSDVARNITGIAKRAVGIADPGVVADLNVQVMDLVDRIRDLQDRDAAMQQEKAALANRIAQLERENAELRDFNIDAQNYELKELAPNAYAYSAKSAGASGQAAAHLCVHCFDRKEKSVLQFESYQPNTLLLRCPACKSAVHKTRSEPSWGGATVGRVRRSGLFEDY